MAINKKLIHFKNKEKFNTELANNNILDTSICFIQDTKEIWTHGQLYDCSVSQAQLDHTVNSRVFTGTKEEYDIAYAAGNIGIGAIVIILDENEIETSTVTALLGTAVLGKMLLGTN